MQPKILRPALLPDHLWLTIIPAVLGLSLAGAGLVMQKWAALLAGLLIVAVFPGLPLFIHAIFHFLVRIDVKTDRLVVDNRAGSPGLKQPRQQAILFVDIDHIFYANREIQVLRELTKSLKNFSIPAKQQDFRAATLKRDFNVPEELLQRFEAKGGNILNNTTAIAIDVAVDDLCHKYKVKRQLRQQLKEGLLHQENQSLAYLTNHLQGIPLQQEDLDEFQDALDQTQVDLLAPFLHTNIDLQRYKKLTRRRGMQTLRLDHTLVFASNQGDQKLYLYHFHDLSKEDQALLIQAIIKANPKVRLWLGRRHRALLLNPASS